MTEHISIACRLLTVAKILTAIATFAASAFADDSSLTPELPPAVVLQDVARDPSPSPRTPGGSAERDQIAALSARMDALESLIRDRLPAAGGTQSPAARGSKTHAAGAVPGDSAGSPVTVIVNLTLSSGTQAPAGYVIRNGIAEPVESKPAPPTKIPGFMPTPAKPKAKPAQKQTAAPARSAIYYRGQSSWTWPGDLRRHLQQAPHGLTSASVAAMSDVDCIRWHERWHNANGRR